MTDEFEAKRDYVRTYLQNRQESLRHHGRKTGPRVVSWAAGVAWGLFRAKRPKAGAQEACTLCLARGSSSCRSHPGNLLLVLRKLLALRECNLHSPCMLSFPLPCPSWEGDTTQFPREDGSILSAHYPCGMSCPQNSGSWKVLGHECRLLGMSL